MFLTFVMQLIVLRKAAPPLAINVETSTHQSVDAFSAVVGPKVSSHDLTWEFYLSIYLFLRQHEWDVKT
jgi:hypothetical protein